VDIAKKYLCYNKFMEKYYKLIRDFISEEHRDFKFQIGRVLASSLSGFMAGATFATIFWIAIIMFLKYFPALFGTKPML